MSDFEILSLVLNFVTIVVMLIIALGKKQSPLKPTFNSDQIGD